MLRFCTILTLLRAAAGDPTSEAEAQALVKLTHLFKRDPAAAETLVRAAKSSAPAPATASPIPYEQLVASVKSTAASPPPPAGEVYARLPATAPCAPPPLNTPPPPDRALGFRPTAP